MIFKVSMIKNKIFRVFLLLLIVFIFLFSRLQNLTAIPVFGDEAIYIRWSQIIKSEETLRFIPQTDGKQPLFMWINAITLKFFSNPLVSGRIVSIFAGLGIIIVLFLLTAIILSYNSKEKNIFRFLQQSIRDNFYPATFTSLIYVLIPFTFFFDRMALADTLLSFFGVLCLFLVLLLSKFPRLDLSLILGFALGLAWLTKSPAIYFVILSLATFIFLNWRQPKLFVLPIISAIIGFLIYNILRLGPQFQMIALRNKDYIWTIGDILKHPLDPLKPHLINTFEIYRYYLSLPLILFPILGFILFIKNKKTDIKNKKYLILLAWWILPLIANCIFAKVFTARYILFTLPPLLVLISIFLFNFFKKIPSNFLKNILLIAIFIPNLVFIFKLSTNPFTQKLPSSEHGYLADWTSGWGIESAYDYLYQRSLVSNVIVGTEGAFGTLPDGLQIYANKLPHFTIIGVGLGFSQLPTNLVDAKNHGDEVYLLINKSRLKLDTIEFNKLKLINSYSKPENDQLLLLQL